MLFASLPFLTLALPVTVALYQLADKRWRNTLLLAASLLFYTWGSGRYLWLLLFVCAVTYLGGKFAHSAKRHQTMIVAATIVISLSPLVYYKYAAFLSDVLADAVAVFGLRTGRLESKALPIGISFFTFQAISYVVDTTYRGASVARNFRNYVLYVSLFPQLIAGPIVRYSFVAEQIETRPESADHVAEGIRRFVHGLGKKVLIADAVAPMANAVFGAGSVSTTAAWIGAFAYAMQIYFDFSGYSDMAVGLGTMFGFTFPENFRRPYSATSITDFWRRWHITLSSWFRDYVFIPLGGSREGTARTYRNLCIVFFLTALWHGAAWTYLLWGGLHAAAMVVERVTGRRSSGTVGARAVFARATTFLLVVLFWVPFRAANIGDAGRVWIAMLTPKGTVLGPDLVAAFTPMSVLALGVGLITVLTPPSWSGFDTVLARTSSIGGFWRTAAMMGVLIASIAALASGSLSPFLYFQF